MCSWTATTTSQAEGLQCQIECQKRGSKGICGDRKSKLIGKLLIWLVPPAGSSPSLSTKIKDLRVRITSLIVLFDGFFAGISSEECPVRKVGEDSWV